MHLLNGVRLAVGFLAVSLSLYLTPPTARAAEDTTGPDNLRTLLATWNQAKTAGDVKMISSYLADDFIGVGPAGHGENKRAFVERVANPKIVVTEIKGRDQTSRVYDKTLVVTGVYDVKGESAGKDISGQYRYVDVWTKSGDRWQIITSTLSKVQE